MVDTPVRRGQALGLALKRLFDLLAAAVGLCVFLPLMSLLALLILVADGPPLLYMEQRVGRHGSLFCLYKFRTLKPGTEAECSVAPEDDPRITRIGLWLRRWRLDELPQLVNVLCGQMSLVGPRPMPPAHASALPRDLLDPLLSVRPGVTDDTAIQFLAEDAVLAGLEDPDEIYRTRLLPAKARMQLQSLQHWSFTGDLCTVARTLALLWSPAAREESARAVRRLL